jgi:hypothetical protein
MVLNWFCLLGLLTGSHAASWGAFKDSPYEGFRWRSYLRSIAIGTAAAIIIGNTRLVIGSDPVVFIGVFYALERLSTEWWKTFLRDDDQTAHSIPMRLGFQGRPVDSRAVRYGVGLIVLVGLIAASAAVTVIQPQLPPLWGGFIIVGGFGGLLTACGGAWKDAPIEGFSGWKFLRSPLVATSWAVPLSMMTQSLVLVTLSAGGFAVASIETYKTFLTGGRPPGKFATKPVRFDLPVARRWLAAVHVSLWAGLAAALVARIGVPLDLVGWPDVTSVRSLLAVSVVAGVSVGVSALVLGSMIRFPSAGR